MSILVTTQERFAPMMLFRAIWQVICRSSAGLWCIYTSHSRKKFPPWYEVTDITAPLPQSSSDCVYKLPQYLVRLAVNNNINQESR